MYPLLSKLKILYYFVVILGIYNLAIFLANTERTHTKINSQKDNTDMKIAMIPLFYQTQRELVLERVRLEAWSGWGRLSSLHN